jgi:hypothetical protein
MMLTQPRALNLGLGLMFLLIDTATYVCAYYMICHNENTTDAQHWHISFILYGYIQSLIGFAAGLWLARITEQQPDDRIIRVKDEEEQVLLLTEIN